MSMFSKPAAPSGGIKWEDHKGALMLIEPLGIETGIQTAFGESDAVRANVSVITGATEAEEYADTLVFPKVLQGQLRSQIGKKVLGRLGQGQGKPGQSAPWVLDEASAEDIAKAEAWVAAQAQPTITSAAAPF